MAGSPIGRFELLTELELAYVIVDAPQGMESSVPPAVGSHLAVVSRSFGCTAAEPRRGSGQTTVVSERYRYLYDERQLRTWTLPIVDIAKRNQGVHVLFNNNHANYATTNALEMGELLAGAGLAKRTRRDDAVPR